MDCERAHCGAAATTTTTTKESANAATSHIPMFTETSMNQ